MTNNKISDLPKLNAMQRQEISKLMKNKNSLNRKSDMDELAEEIASALVLSGFNNSQAAYVLTNVMRHILSFKKNKKELKKVFAKANINLDVDNLNIDALTMIQRVFANQYRSKVDDKGVAKK